MILTLEISGAEGSKLGPARRRQLGENGGTLGRDGANDLVLPDGKVSSSHARVTYREGTFYIEDTSRNGICINSPRNRLDRGRPYALQPADCILIEPYEIRVSIGAGIDDDTRPFAEPPRMSQSDPFDWERTLPIQPSIPSAAEASGEQQLDPLKLIPGQSPKRAPVQTGPTIRELNQGPAWEAHYQPPRESPPRPPAPSPFDPAGSQIPENYNPLLDDRSAISTPVPRPEPVPPLVVSAPVPPPPTPIPKRQLTDARPSVPVDDTPPPVRPRPVRPERTSPPADGDGMTAFLSELLAGAGLEGAVATPELASQFGEILRVVVSGVMDILQARHAIKEEFRMHMTHFRPTNNNPLKFSANVDDALHNLLVKRNAAYLPPVEAFADAFDDLRHHQIATLEGMRVAFESMLGQFEPEALQQRFDRQLEKGSLLSVPAKLRYWEFYRDMCAALLKDREASFRELFGEEFADAYDKQLERLKRERDPSR